VGAAELARIDPAALSARITGMMTARLMRMIPPWHLQRSASLQHGLSSQAGGIEVTWSYRRNSVCLYIDNEIVWFSLNIQFALSFAALIYQ
jgi:hypothetical protein